LTGHTLFAEELHKTYSKRPILQGVSLSVS